MPEWIMIKALPADRLRSFGRQAMGAGILALLALSGVAKGQQPHPAPAQVDPALPVNEAAREMILKKLNSIIIPRLDFENTTLEEAVEFLRLRAAELDAVEADPSKKGVNFVIVPPQDATAKRLNIAELKLRNVPLGRVIQYICEQTNHQYSVDDTAVILSPKKEDGGTSKATVDLEKAIAEQEAKVKEHRKYLTVISNRMSQKYGPGTYFDHHANFLFENFKTIETLSKEKLRIEGDLEVLRKGEGDDLLSIASKDLFDIRVPEELLRLKRELEATKAGGLGDNHPEVIDKAGYIALRTSMLEGRVARARGHLSTRLHYVSHYLEHPEKFQAGLLERETQDRLNKQEYLVTRGEYDYAVETLRQMKLKLEAEMNE